MTKEDLALLKKITYGVVSKKDLANKCLEFAWNIIEYFNDRPPTELLDNAMKYLMDVATGDDFLKEKIEPFLLRCTQYCQKQISVPCCAAMINKVVDELPNTLSFYYHYTKNSAIELIFQPDWMLLESIVENLQKFKSEMSAKLKQKEAKIMVDEKASTSQSGLEAALDSLQNNKLTYIENIRKRSDYLFMISKYKPKNSLLIQNIIMQTWSTLIENSYLAKEKDIVYKWLAEFLTSPFGESMVTAEFLEKIYDQKLSAPGELMYLSEDGFACVKIIFSLINQERGNLLRVKKRSQQRVFF